MDIGIFEAAKIVWEQLWNWTSAVLISVCLLAAVNSIIVSLPSRGFFLCLCILQAFKAHFKSWQLLQSPFDPAVHSLSWVFFLSLLFSLPSPLLSALLLTFSLLFSICLHSFMKLKCQPVCHFIINITDMYKVNSCVSIQCLRLLKAAFEDWLRPSVATWPPPFQMHLLIPEKQRLQRVYPSWPNLSKDSLHFADNVFFKAVVVQRVSIKTSKTLALLLGNRNKGGTSRLCQSWKASVDQTVTFWIGLRSLPSPGRRRS